MLSSFFSSFTVYADAPEETEKKENASQEEVEVVEEEVVEEEEPEDIDEVSVIEFP